MPEEFSLQTATGSVKCFNHSISMQNYEIASGNLHCVVPSRYSSDSKFESRMRIISITQTIGLHAIPNGGKMGFQ
jgi:hypothetical protein